MKVSIIGFLLTVTFWIFSWTRIAGINEWAFFPLWLGYIITINGISEILFKESLLKKMGFLFLLLFIISIPMWWYFEFMNGFLQNWHYIAPRQISALEYTIRASIDFSIVIPAVLSATFLFKKVIEKINKCEFKRRNLTPPVLVFIIILGIISLFAMPVFPTILFPFLWISVYLIIDPINYFFGGRSLFKDFSLGKGIDIISLMTATLFTGFWWEMWNFYSLPKWNYTVPYVGFYKIFEMPILGYLGYIPFSFEVFSYTILFFTLVKVFYNRISFPEF